jgi:hypothetical protein
MITTMLENAFNARQEKNDANRRRGTNMPYTCHHKTKVKP